METASPLVAGGDGASGGRAAAAEGPEPEALAPFPLRLDCRVLRAPCTAGVEGVLGLKALTCVCCEYRASSLQCLASSLYCLVAMRTLPIITTKVGHQAHLSIAHLFQSLGIWDSLKEKFRYDSAISTASPQKGGKIKTLSIQLVIPRTQCSIHAPPHSAPRNSDRHPGRWKGLVGRKKAN